MFFLLPVSVDHRAQRVPVVTFWLIGLCTAFYVLSLFLWISGGEARLESWYELAAFIPAKARPLTWISNLFVHAGLFHLLGNMVYLYLFGACIEDLLGPGRFIAFYLIAGIVATASHVMLSAEGFRSDIPLMGASGAISACMGACALLLRGMKVEFRFIYFFIFAAGNKTFFVPSWLMMTLWFADDLLGLLSSLNQTGGGVAFGAHVGGFLFGLAVAFGLRGRLAREVAAGNQGTSSAVVIPVAVVGGPAPVFVHYEDQQHGPLAVHEVWHGVRSGDIPADALYWRDDLQEWRPVAEL